MSEPQMSEGARALLRGYDERHAMPSGVEDRIAQRLAQTIADERGPAEAARVVPMRSRGTTAVTVALLAAAAAFLVWWLLPDTRRVVADAEGTPMSAPHEASDPGSDRTATLRSPSEASVPSEANASEPGAQMDAMPEAAPAPAPDPVAADAIEPDAASKKPRAAVAPRETPIAPEPAPTEHAASLTEDAEVLSRAQAALRIGDGASALTHLAEHARRFPSSALAEERAALRVLALCEAGRREDAAREREAFLQKFPRSPSRSRVTKACAEEAK